MCNYHYSGMHKYCRQKTVNSFVMFKCKHLWHVGIPKFVCINCHIYANEVINIMVFASCPYIIFKCLTLLQRKWSLNLEI